MKPQHRCVACKQWIRVGEPYAMTSAGTKHYRCPVFQEDCAEIEETLP